MTVGCGENDIGVVQIGNQSALIGDSRWPSLAPIAVGLGSTAGGRKAPYRAGIGEATRGEAGDMRLQSEATGAEAHPSRRYRHEVQDN